MYSAWVTPRELLKGVLSPYLNSFSIFWTTTGDMPVVNNPEQEIYPDVSSGIRNSISGSAENLTRPSQAGLFSHASEDSTSFPFPNVSIMASSSFFAMMSLSHFRNCASNWSLCISLKFHSHTQVPWNLCLKVPWNWRFGDIEPFTLENLCTCQNSCQKGRLGTRGACPCKCAQQNCNVSCRRGTKNGRAATEFQ